MIACFLGMHFFFAFFVYFLPNLFLKNEYIVWDKINLGKYFLCLEMGMLFFL